MFIYLHKLVLTLVTSYFHNLFSNQLRQLCPVRPRPVLWLGQRGRPVQALRARPAPRRHQLHAFHLRGQRPSSHREGRVRPERPPSCLRQDTRGLERPGGGLVPPLKREGTI